MCVCLFRGEVHKQDPALAPLPHNTGTHLSPSRPHQTVTFGSSPGSPVHHWKNPLDLALLDMFKLMKVEPHCTRTPRHVQFFHYAAHTAAKRVVSILLKCPLIVFSLHFFMTRLLGAWHCFNGWYLMHQNAKNRRAIWQSIYDRHFSAWRKTINGWHIAGHNYFHLGNCT